MKVIKIEAVRSQLNVKKEVFSEMIGISLNTYNRKLKGQSEWLAREIDRIRVIGHLEPDDVIDYSPIRD